MDEQTTENPTHQHTTLHPSLTPPPPPPTTAPDQSITHIDELGLSVRRSPSSTAWLYRPIADRKTEWEVADPADHPDLHRDITSHYEGIDQKRRAQRLIKTQNQIQQDAYSTLNQECQALLLAEQQIHIWQAKFALHSASIARLVGITPELHSNPIIELNGEDARVEIGTLDVSQRVLDALKDVGIKTLGDLSAATDRFQNYKRLKKSEGMGPAKADEVELAILRRFRL